MIVYPGAVPLETDILNVERMTLIGLGYLMQDVLGVSTLVTGLACAPTSPASMAVKLSPGRIYALANVDNSAYGSLNADTTHQIVKQGILADAITLNCPAPGTTGQSINYLIEAQYQDQDNNLLVLPYYNSANPTQSFTGPGGNNQPQATQRQGLAVVQVKAGIPATTGTQATPSVDAGWTALYVVTVAFGASTITSGNISTVSGAPFYAAGAASGFWTPTYIGFSAAPAGVATWTKAGGLTRLQLPSSNGTSNSSSFGITNLPAAIQPATACSVPAGGMIDNTISAVARTDAFITGASINFALGGLTNGWTASGSKGFQGTLLVF